ncbi:5'-deoxyadenosine deaminase [Syntrophomonas erecta]
MSILIKNGTLVTMNPAREILQCDIFIKQDRIVQIGELDNISADQIIDATGKLVIPGLIQTHIHLCQVLFRGMADDLELLDWLKLKIWPLEGAHDEESLYYSALLGCAELLRGGTTAIIDMATVHHTDSVFQAVNQSGLRYLGGKCMMDHGEGVPTSLLDTTEKALQESMDLYEKWNGHSQQRIRYAFCPRFAVSCTHDLLQKVQRLSYQYSIPVHTHASENKGEIQVVQKERGMRNILYLNQLGLCNPNLILAHCIHVNPEEMQVLSTSQTHISHCPGSNLKLASGIAPVPDMLQQGCQVSLGADGAPCNNNLSAFIEMRLAALIQKPLHGPTVMPAKQVFEMATLGGAKALGCEDQLGSLEEGKKADIAIVDLQGWHTKPNEGASVYSQMVYQAQASDVYATIVDGNLLMLNGQLFSIHSRDLDIKSRQSLSRVIKRAGL